MKRIIFTSAIFIFSIAMLAQVPAGFNYQAVVRNNSGEFVASQNVRFKISILENSATGTPVYIESHYVSTNDFGLANLVVGQGEAVLGILMPGGWGLASHYLKIEIDITGGVNFTHMGTMQLLAVPYAFHAQTVAEESDGDPENEIQELEIDGMELSLTKNGGTVTLPTGNDDWGEQAVESDTTLAGDGTEDDPLKIALNAVDSTKIVNGTVSREDLEDDAVNSEKIADGSISTEDLEAGSVTSQTIMNGSIAGADLSNGAVTSEKIADHAVTSDKIADDAVNSAEIADGSISNEDLGTNSVTSLTIADQTITAADLSDGAVTADKLGSMGALAGEVLKWSGTEWVSGADLTGGGLWTQNGDNIFYNTGKVGVGADPADDLRQFQVRTEDIIAIAGINNSFYATIFAENTGSGPAAEFRNKLRILDGTQGTGKVLTSDVNGYTSWQTPSSSPWVISGSDIYFDDGKVAIGKDPGTDLRQFQVFGGSNIAVAADNNSASFAALYASNSASGGLAARFENASGPVARFGRNIIIADGTQGIGKVLTSDANGVTSWEIPGTSPWTINGSEIHYDEGKVGIGGTNTSVAQLLVKTGGSEIARFESSSGSNWIGMYTNGARKGMLWSTGNEIKLRSDDGGIALQTNGNNDRLKIEADGDIDANGVVIESDGDVTTSAAGASKNLLPVAYGYVNSTGTLLTSYSTGNVSAARTGSAGTYRYTVTISGISSYFNVVVTPSGSYTSFPTVTYSSNTFTVNFVSHNGNDGQASNFSFIVIEP